MNPKEFIKPTKGKIIVCIILLVLIFLLSGVASKFSVSCPSVVGITCRQPLISRLSYGISSFLMLPQYIVNDTTLFKIGIKNSVVSFTIFLAIDLVYLYLFAATIVFITNKIRKN